MRLRKSQPLAAQAAIKILGSSEPSVWATNCGLLNSLLRWRRLTYKSKFEKCNTQNCGISMGIPPFVALS
jgi:hypothetical protein